MKNKILSVLCAFVILICNAGMIRAEESCGETAKGVIEENTEGEGAAQDGISGDISGENASAEDISSGDVSSEESGLNETTNETMNSMDNDSDSVTGTFSETDPDFLMEFTADKEQVKAGEELTYRLSFYNPMPYDINIVQLESIFSSDLIQANWVNTIGEMVLADESADQICIAAGTRQEYILQITIPENLIVPLEHSVFVSAEAKNENIRKTAEICTVILPLVIDFEVVKTADRSAAVPGDKVMYQICIRNTGERTLHSVMSTERFQAENITAVFLPQEGVLLNKDRTKAYIASMDPGTEVNLKAEVTLPASVKAQELVNQVLVVTEETGEIPILSQAVINVEEARTDKDNSTVNDADNNLSQTGAESMVQSYEDKSSGSTFVASPVKTEDSSNPSRWIQILSASAILIVVLAVTRFRKKRKDMAEIEKIMKI